MGDLDRVKAIGGGGVDLTIGSALDIFGIRKSSGSELMCAQGRAGSAVVSRRQRAAGGRQKGVDGGGLKMLASPLRY